MIITKIKKKVNILSIKEPTSFHVTRCQSKMITTKIKKKEEYLINKITHLVPCCRMLIEDGHYEKENKEMFAMESLNLFRFNRC